MVRPFPSLRPSGRLFLNPLPQRPAHKSRHMVDFMSTNPELKADNVFLVFFPQKKLYLDLRVIGQSAPVPRRLSLAAHQYFSLYSSHKYVVLGDRLFIFRCPFCFARYSIRVTLYPSVTTRYSSLATRCPLPVPSYPSYHSLLPTHLLITQYLFPGQQKRGELSRDVDRAGGWWVTSR